VRTAIYIEDGVIQLVLTPDNEWEKKALRAFEDKPFAAQIFGGSFYDCRGGWVRQNLSYPSMHGHAEAETKSLILRVDRKAEPEILP
jgi:hypothetical protein